MTDSLQSSALFVLHALKNSTSSDPILAVQQPCLCGSACFKEPNLLKDLLCRQGAGTYHLVQISACEHVVATFGRENPTDCRASPSEPGWFRRQRSCSRSKMIALIQDMRSQGHTLQAIADYLNINSYQTHRAGKWYPTTITNVLKKVVNEQTGTC